jgi:hypothetical protein
MSEFRIKMLEDVHSGLTFEIAAGDKERGVRRKDSIYIDEDVFGYIEQVIRGRCPKLAHWGITEIPRANWLDIVSDLSMLQGALASGKSIEDVITLGFVFEHLKADFSANFDVYKIALVEFITRLCEWIHRQIESNDILTVYGI